MGYKQSHAAQCTFAVLHHWLSSKQPEPVDEIAAVLTVLRDKLYSGRSDLNGSIIE